MHTWFSGAMSFFNVVGCVKVGSYEAIAHQFMVAIPNSTISYQMQGINDNLHNCDIPPANSFHLFRTTSDTNLPSTGIVIGLTISSVWYRCTDQVWEHDQGAAATRIVAMAVAVDDAVCPVCYICNCKLILLCETS